MSKMIDLVRKKIPEIDVVGALNFSANDEMIYEVVIESFVDEAPQIAENIENSRRSEKYLDYATYTHSLKSMSRLLGYIDLSENAAKLEQAGKEKDIYTITNETDMVLSQVKEIVDKLQDVLKEV